MHSTKRTKKTVTLLWFNGGKGYGQVLDLEGNRFFLHGGEIGGDLYGVNADRLFIQQNRKYIITSYWISPGKQSQPDYFFMGSPFRVKTITLLNGKKPMDRASVA